MIEPAGDFVLRASDGYPMRDFHAKLLRLPGLIGTAFGSCTTAGLPLDFRHCFPDHDAHTVQLAGLKGKKNGELMQSAESAGYQVLLTVDNAIPRRHSLSAASFRSF